MSNWENPREVRSGAGGPKQQIGAKFGHGRKRYRSVRRGKKEARTVRRAVQNARVQIRFRNLFKRFRDRFVARAGEFIFPADDFGFWEPVTEMRQNLCRG